MSFDETVEKVILLLDNLVPAYITDFQSCQSLLNEKLLGLENDIQLQFEVPDKIISQFLVALRNKYIKEKFAKRWTVIDYYYELKKEL